MRAASPPPTIWFGNLKDRAHEWFVERAERFGIPWKKTVENYQDLYTFETLKMWKRRLENRSMIYPEYFLKPFHGYDHGNMGWKPAMECEVATHSI